MLFSSIFCCRAVGDIRVTFVGDSYTGKTTIINKLIGSQNTASDITTSVIPYNFPTATNRTAVLYDTPGLETYIKFLKESFPETTDVLIICLDSNPDTYQDRLSYWWGFVNSAELSSKRTFERIIVLNKTDSSEVSNNVEVAKQAIRAAHNDIPENQIIPCNAKTGAGIDKLEDCLFGIATQLRQQEQRQRQKRRKNLTIGDLVTAGMVTICYGAHTVYKRFTSKDKDKNLNTDKLKKNYNKTRVKA